VFLLLAKLRQILIKNFKTALHSIARNQGGNEEKSPDSSQGFLQSFDIKNPPPPHPKTKNKLVEFPVAKKKFQHFPSFLVEIRKKERRNCPPKKIKMIPTFNSTNFA
jgi:hypothetical protein